MPIVSFWIMLVCILAAIAFFSYGLWLLSKNKSDKAGSKMNIGFGIGLIGLVLTAIVYGFFYL